MACVLIPLIISAALVARTAIHKIEAQGEKELEDLRAAMLDDRKEGLKDLMETVESMIREVRENPELSEQEKKTEVRDRLRSVKFADANYVFAYDRNITNLAYRPDPSKEGTKPGAEASALIRNLFKAAEGDGYFQYTWMNPASGKVEPKMSYTLLIPEWDWLIGAGIYITSVDEKIEESKEGIFDALSEALNEMILATLAIVGITAIFCYWIVGRSVSKPLDRIIDAMESIANGEGDLTQRLPAHGKDELSTLASKFNTFVMTIQATIQKVGSTTEQLAAAAEELSHVASETRQSVDVQGSETDQIASAINQMAATTQQISGNANEVQMAASDADKLAKDGGQTIATARESVNLLSDDIQASASSISALAEKTDEIQRVLDVIHDVTERTNLLALNAAIEAARAGEHGRGFAVVADEVRQLARRSADSADQISEIIEGFVRESKVAVEAMELSQSRSVETVDRTEHANNALKTIERSVESITDQVTQIAAASEQQSQVAEEINQNVVRIVEAAQNSSAGVQQTSEASEELARLGETLRGLVSRFRV